MRCAGFLLVLLFLYCADAAAQVNSTRFSNLRVVPDPVAAGELVSARILHAQCIGSPEFVNGMQTTVQGNAVTLTIQMELDPNIVCLTTPPPPSDEDFAVGRFAPGTYTLTVQPVSDTPGLSYAPLTTTFTVGAASSIPVLSGHQLLLLALILIGTAGIALRVRSD